MDDIFQKEMKRCAAGICNAVRDRNKEELKKRMKTADKDQLQEICSLEDKDGKSPIRYTIVEAKGDPAMLKIMIEKGARLDVKLGPERMTVLHLAVNLEDEKILRDLISEDGVEIDTPDSEGETALHYSVKGGTLELCKILIKSGAKVNAQDKCGRTALHMLMGLMIRDPIEKIKLVCKNKADPNIQDNKGDTPLHMLLRRTSGDIFQILNIILTKLDPQLDLKNKEGDTALDLYKGNNSAEDVQKVESMLSKKHRGRSHSVPQLSHSESASVGPKRKTSMDTLKGFFTIFRRKSSQLPDIQQHPDKPVNDAVDNRSIRQRAGQNEDGNYYEEVTLGPDISFQDEPFPELKERLERVGEFVKKNSYQLEDDQRPYDFEDAGVTEAYLTDDDDDLSSGLSSNPNSRKASSTQNPSVLGVDMRYSPDPTGNNTDLNRTLDNGEVDPRYTISNVYTGHITLPVPTKAVAGTSARTAASPIAARRTAETVTTPTPAPTTPTPALRGAAAPRGAAADEVVEKVVEEIAGTAMPTGEAAKPAPTASPRKSVANISTGATEVSVEVHKAGIEDCCGSDYEDSLNGNRISNEIRHSNGSTKANLSNIPEMPPQSSEDESSESEDEAAEDEDSPFAVLYSKSESECMGYLETYSERENLVELRSLRSKESPLHVATKRSFNKLAKYLINSGVDVNATDKGDLTSLHIAANRGKLELVNTLINSGANIERITLEGKSALDLAVASDHTPVVEHLLRKETLSTSLIESALHIFSRERRDNGMRALFIQHIDNRVKSGNIDIHLILPLAAKREHWHVLKFLIEQRKLKHCSVGLDKRDECGYAAVHYCAMSNSLEPLKKLCEAGASVLRKSKIPEWRGEPVAQIETVKSIATERRFRDILKYVSSRVRTGRASEN